MSRKAYYKSGGDLVLEEPCPSCPIDFKYNYKYNGKERQDELGLNWDSFKWRNYDYAIGRFFNMDKLAEDYSYQSPYNFAENRVVDGREMEGLEWTSSTSSDGKTVNLNLNVRTVNNSVGIISNEQMATLANERAAQLSSSLGGLDSQGRTVNVTVTYRENATMVWEYTNALSASGVKDLAGKSESKIATALAIAQGITDEVGNTQVNRTQLNIAHNELMKFDENGNAVFENKTTRANTAQTGAHEDLHTLGGRHETDPLNNSPSKKSQKKDKNNLINESATGTNVLPAQRTEFIENVEKQQNN
ncbi:hypothetical protein LXD69_09490 [Flavobacterium sediminilitoris]|uniref:RHS repeat-associated protein n=1 Tax=Flavobacterium sediminilitoris TaxID=2024526 RepID=A0ABY4HJ50_9FLAO|nr:MULTISPECIES: hypothetical protein [Flavobacterium]UOX32287.1 hypothetical protein LXD69_09490 [Flavobacterium sediminilitoris]